MSRQKSAKAQIFVMPFELQSGSSCAPFFLQLQPSFARSAAHLQNRSFFFFSPADKWATFVISAAPPGIGLRGGISSFRLFKISAHSAFVPQAPNSLTHLSFAVGEQKLPPQISPFLNLDFFSLLSLRSSPF